MTEIFSQLRREAEICKYVFGSVTVTMFSCCFFPNLKLFITTLGEKKKKKNLYVNLSKYSKENKLAIKFSFYICCFTQKNVLAIWNVLGWEKLLSLKYRCRTILGLCPGYSLFSRCYYSSRYTFSNQTSSLGHCRDIGHVWTAALGLILESEHFYFWRGNVDLLLQNDSKMLNVSLRQTTLTYMFIQ